MTPQAAQTPIHPGHATGPRTTEGKARVARNAITHGLTCRDVLLPEDDRAEFARFRAAMVADGQPVGAEEQNLVERMVAAHWRTQRLWRQEAGVYANARHRLDDPQASVGVCLLKDLQDEGGFVQLNRHEATLNREYHRCSRRLQELQALRRKGLRHVEEDAAPASEDIVAPAAAPSAAAATPWAAVAAAPAAATPATPSPETSFGEIAKQTPPAGPPGALAPHPHFPFARKEPSPAVRTALRYG